MPREFMPILRHPDFKLPWSLIEPHAAQAMKNHGQTLERLAERGGLGFSEALAIMCDLDWRYIGRHGGEDGCRQSLETLIAKRSAAGVKGTPAALTDEQAEALIEASDGHWKEDVFCIGGPELMALLRAAAGVAVGAWHPMSESPPKPGRYIVAHRGGTGGDAYFNAPGKPGWSKLEDFNFTHWCEPPDGVAMVDKVSQQISREQCIEDDYHRRANATKAQQQAQRQIEDWEVVAESLDEAGIPRADDDGAVYSLWGRIERYARTRGVKEDVNG